MEYIIILSIVGWIIYKISINLDSFIEIFNQIDLSDKKDNKDFKLSKEEIDYYSDIYMSKQLKKDHVTSDYWYNLKQEKLQLEGSYCKGCGKLSKYLDLHHITYKHLGAEKLKDVELLCRDCHNKLHLKINQYGREFNYPLSILKD